MKQSLSALEARRMALAAQAFGRRVPATPGTRQLNATLRRMHTLQIDSVNVYARSHYMPLFSRLGPYDTALLDRLLFARRAPYVEFWAHVAAFIPASDWQLFRFRMDDHRARFTAPGTWFAENLPIVEWVRAELGARGPLRPAEIEHDSRRGGRGPWWDWDGVKRALEYLWLIGEVAVAGRRGFERRYALAAGVIPAAALGREIARPDAIRELVVRAAAAYGVATEADLDDYWRLRDRKAVKRATAELVEEGELVPVTVEGWDRGGKPLPAWAHRDAALPRRVDAATVLTPFDPMVWFRDRAQRMFGFDYRIEIYTPAPQRRYGYYSLPILLDDELVGRVDLKADRAGSRLLVQSAWWEDGPVRPDAAPRVAEVLRDAARWQGLDGISVANWGDATGALADVLGAPRHEAGPESIALAPDEPQTDEPDASSALEQGSDS
ncbi:winged helix-turn-helix domain-containing protein [Microbacterium lacus]|uniref:winged helix-turn-helix domain-containing protein n=1 Tax=Microbacterium lacus TaxID=415217 RepID=UPI000C2C7AC7|nr:crosslink repair DNA glycosylase YcaQ family protein [Microbacterium lacus]